MPKTVLLIKNNGVIIIEQMMEFEPKVKVEVRMVGGNDNLMMIEMKKKSCPFGRREK